MKRALAFVGVLLIGVGHVSLARASSSDGTIDATNRYAWTENVGWIDLGSSDGNVHVTDDGLTGYAWSELAGWISLDCSNTGSCGTVDFGVDNDAEGTLTGYAWSENAGWIDFDPAGGGVSIDSDGDFAGYAWGENIGWIVFNCATTSTCGTVDYKVSTDWRPLSVRGGASSSSSSSSSVASSVASRGGGGGGGGRRNIGELMKSATQSKRLSTLVPSAPPPNRARHFGSSLQQRTCARVDGLMRRAPSVTLLARINARLAKRFGFTCG